MGQTLELEFLTDQNKTVKIAIPNAISPADTTKVDAVLDQLVASGILQFKTGHVVKKAGAQMRDTGATTVVAKG